MKSKNVYLCVMSILIFISSAIYSQTTSQSYKMLEEINFQQKLGNPYPNAIKNFAIAVDKSRNRAYISPILNTDFPIIDLANNKQIGSLKTTYKTGFNLVSLYVNPKNGFLYTYYNPLHQVDMLLRVFDPSTNQEKGTYTLSSSIGAIAAHPLQNHIIIGEGQKLKILNADNLSPIDSVPLPIFVADIFIDSAVNKMYIASSNLVLGTKQRVTVIDLSKTNYPVEKNIDITTTAPLGKIYIDNVNNRLILLGSSLLKVVKLSDQTEILSKSFPTKFVFSDYSAKFQKLFLLDETGYVANGEKGDWIKLFTYDFTSNKLDSIKGGLRTDQFGIDDKNGKLFVPIMHSGDVEVYDISTMQKKANIDIGESVEDMVISPDGKVLYVADRLGDNSVCAYNFNTKTATTFQPGNWPVAIDIDTTLNRLFTMNHYESSVSVVSIPENTVIKKIELTGFNEARTDGLSSMYLCNTNHKLYVVTPECQKLAVIDCQNMTLERTMSINGYTWNEDEKAVGKLQVITAPDLGYLYILRSTSKKINRYNSSTYAFIDSLDLSSKWNARLEDFSGDLLAYDPNQNPKKLYVGPIAINAQLNTILPQLLVNGSRFLGYNQNKTKAFSLGILNNYIYAYEHDPSSMLVSASRRLNKAVYGTPIFYLDAKRNNLYTGEFTIATVYKYDLVNLEMVNIDNNIVPGKFYLDQNFPNPFNPSTVIRFGIGKHLSGENIPVSLKIYDIMGREKNTIINERMAPGEYSVTFNSNGLPSGVYYYKLQADNYQSIKKMLLLR